MRRCSGILGLGVGECGSGVEPVVADGGHVRVLMFGAAWEGARRGYGLLPGGAGRGADHTEQSPLNISSLDSLTRG